MIQVHDFRQVPEIEDVASSSTLDLHMLKIRASAPRVTNNKCLKAPLLECEKENNSRQIVEIP